MSIQPSADTVHIPTSDLLARIHALESELASYRAMPAPLPKARRTSKRSDLDFRTAGELWRAGEIVRNAPAKAYKGGQSKSVLITFADGECLRLSTYLDGPMGIASTARTAKAIRQGQFQAPAEWCRDGNGVWRAIDICACPEILVAEYVD